MPRGGFRLGSGRPKKGEIRVKRERVRQKSIPTEKKCALCGETYTNKRYRYCSPECLSAASYKKQRSYHHICSTCGKNFEGQKKQKCCSEECAHRINFRMTQDGTIEKKCTKCGEYKQFNKDNFSRDKSRQDGLASYCKQCMTKAVVYRKRTERGKALAKLSRIRNIETVRAYNKKIRPIVNERARVRLKTDIAYSLNNRMKSLMYSGLRKNKGGKTWQELAGYSIDDLRRHIEKRFKSGMSWDLFLAGAIHLDHIIPRAAFNFSHPNDPDFKKCWSLKNLQPLWAADNLIKSDKLDKPFQPSLAIGGR